MSRPCASWNSAAERLGGELGHAVDVARRRRRNPRRARPLRRSAAGADRLGDHQRGGRGEQEAVVAGGDRGFEQIAGALDIDLMEGRFGVADDVRLVQRAGVDHRLDAMLAEQPVDQGPVRDRAEHVGVGARRDVEPGHRVAGGAQPRGEEPAEPAGGAGQEDAHRVKPTESSRRKPGPMNTGLVRINEGFCTCLPMLRFMGPGFRRDDFEMPG